jgi:hypothetical protein
MTTTSNGGSQGRITAHVEGTVESANERGLRLDGESDWRNFSKWTSEPITPPRRGSNVRLALDAAGFVRSIEVLDQAPSPTSSSNRDHTITRLSVLKTAANFLGAMAQVHEDVRSDHVLVLAERWLAWVEQEGGDAELAQD